jgi:hypothetical protein
MKVYKVTINESDVCCEKNDCDVMEHLRTHINEGGEGDKMTVEISEMTEAEYRNLAEFQGF